ncbi:MAG: DUF1156 domain-containing protein [Acidimicrobiia bacterium]|nr:DUF1156 domain-containing protein [Acidimicrobiia bacterium]
MAVLINKAMIEIPPRFAGMPPVHPNINKTLTTWERAQGLAADVEAYGQYIRDAAQRRIGHLYPDATGPNGEKLTPIAWIWARTVESPDPAWSGYVPLVASWTLANRPGKPKVWIEPIINQKTQTITYQIRQGGEPELERTIGRGGGVCIATGASIPLNYIRAEGLAQRLSAQLMAVVAEGAKGRVYTDPPELHIDVSEYPQYSPSALMPTKHRNFQTPGYGMNSYGDLFTPRQLIALTTFSDLLGEVAEQITADAFAAGMADDGVRLRDGGCGAVAYADAIVTYLAFAVDRMADRNSTICSWDSSRQHARNVFARQAIPMSWDFAENNPLGSSSGSWINSVVGIARALEGFSCLVAGEVVQRDARARVRQSKVAAVSTDPPYYDNISYADLSDFFYVWLRRNLSDVWPDECSTLLTPKAEELIANRYRSGSKEVAEEFFESGMAEFMAQVAKSQCEDVPATIYYAYKATETRDGEVRATGWDTFLQAMVDAGLQVTATWPMRTELGNRLVASKSNALASSIVLACRARPSSAQLATRGEFMAALRDELPEAVRVLQSGNIAPVDMAQSTIGPGIKVFSRYAKVVEADGSSMPVSTALAIINDVLGEVLDGEEAELDRDSRFALSWFAEHGYNPGPSGDADSVANAKNTSLAGIEESGIGEARAGKFCLYERCELAEGWQPAEDPRLTVWEALQYLIAALERSESEAAELLHTLGSYAERARQLAYLLYQKANNKGWTTEAASYNNLITAWTNLQTHPTHTTQPTML